MADSCPARSWKALTRCARPTERDREGALFKVALYKPVCLRLGRVRERRRKGNFHRNSEDEYLAKTTQMTD